LEVFEILSNADIYKGEVVENALAAGLPSTHQIFKNLAVLQFSWQ